MKTLSKITKSATIRTYKRASHLPLTLKRETYFASGGLMRFSEKGRLRLNSGMSIEVWYVGLVDYTQTTIYLSTIWKNISYSVLLENVGYRKSGQIRHAALAFAERINSNRKKGLKK